MLSYYKMKGEYWAKFDDDDFYGENYLVNNVFFINKTGADLLGKKTIYLYACLRKIEI